MPACFGKTTASRRTAPPDISNLVPADLGSRHRHIHSGHHEDGRRRHAVGLPQQYELHRQQHSVVVSWRDRAPARFSRRIWTTNLEASFSHPLLQGGGAAIQPDRRPDSFRPICGRRRQPDRRRHDRPHSRRTNRWPTSKAACGTCVHDVEDAYWELYFAYRDLEARKMGRDSALETWKKTAALYRTGSQWRQRRPRGPSPFAILLVPFPSGASAYGCIPRRESAAVYHGPADVRRQADPPVG